MRGPCVAVRGSVLSTRAPILTTSPMVHADLDNALHCHSSRLNEDITRQHMPLKPALLGASEEAKQITHTQPGP